MKAGDLIRWVGSLGELCVLIKRVPEASGIRGHFAVWDACCVENGNVYQVIEYECEVVSESR